MTFFYFFNWFPRNPSHLDSAIQKAGKPASKAAGKLSTDLKSSSTCLVFIQTVERMAILNGNVWVV